MESNNQNDGGYYSCEWLEGGLAFNRRSLHTCLIVHHGRGFPFLAEYNGEDIKVSEILAARRKMVEENRSGKIHEACRGCAHLKKREWPAKEYDFDIIGIAQYSHCNIKCNYCFLQTQDRSSFVDGFKPYRLFDRMEELYYKGHLSPNAIIDWGGGEPTIYKEFDRIADITLQRGAFHYLHTNGVRFPELLQGHPKSHKMHAICSVDAGLPETYFKMKARDYLEQVWQSLEKYIQAKCMVTLKYIVKEENCSLADIDPFVKRAKEIGAQSVVIDIDYNKPKSSPQVLEGLSQLYHRGQQQGLHVEYGFTGENFDAEGKTADQLADKIEVEMKAAEARAKAAEAQAVEAQAAEAQAVEAREQAEASQQQSLFPKNFIPIETLARKIGSLVRI